MITGFNSDIEYGGKIFHVQTEEKGLDNPIVLTLVYCGGEIVTSLEASYADIVDEESTPEAEIRRRMSVQHQELIQSIRRGKFTPTQMPYGHDLITDRSLDELVLGYLEDSIVERTVKVGRVLTKLERFLTAAERAKVESEAPAAPAEVESPVEPTEVEGRPGPAEAENLVETEQVADEIFEATEIDPNVAAATTERRRRKSGWLWAAVAAAIIVGAAAWFTMGVESERPVDRAVEPGPPAPVVESNVAPASQNVAQHAGVAAIPDVRLPVEEPAAETTPEDAQPQATVAAPTPEPVQATPTEDRTPTVAPEPDEALVEDDAAATPEPDAAPEVEQPVEVDTPVVRQDEVDVPPMAKHRDLPRYTRRARRLQQEGVVELRIRIDSHGDVAEVIVLSEIPDSDLNEAAVDVARDWSFSPARKNGRRVQVWKDVGFEFTVRPDRTTSVRIRE